MDDNVIPAKFGKVFNSLDSVVSRNVAVLGGMAGANTNVPSFKNAIDEVTTGTAQNQAANINSAASRSVMDNGLLSFFNDSSNPYLETLKDSQESLVRIEEVLSDQLKVLDDMLYNYKEEFERRQTETKEEKVDESIVPPREESKQEEEQKKEEDKRGLSSFLTGLLGPRLARLLMGPLGLGMAALYGGKMLVDYVASQRITDPDELREMNERATEQFESTGEFAGGLGAPVAPPQEEEMGPYQFPGSENAQIESPLSGDTDFIDPNNVLTQRMRESGIEGASEEIQRYLDQVGRNLQAPAEDTLPQTQPSGAAPTIGAAPTRPTVPSIGDMIGAMPEESGAPSLNRSVPQMQGAPSPGISPLRPGSGETESMTREEFQRLSERRSEILERLDELQTITDEGIQPLRAEDIEEHNRLFEELDRVFERIEPYMMGPDSIQLRTLGDQASLRGRTVLDQMVASLNGGMAGVGSQNLDRYLSMANFASGSGSASSQPVSVINAPITNNYGGDTNVSRGGDTTVIASGHDSLAPPQLIHNLPSSIA